MNIGNRIKELRRQKGLTQEELAKMLKTIRSTLSNWETNRTSPDPETLKELARIFNVSVDYFLEEGNIDRVAEKREDFITISARDIERLRKMNALSSEDQAMFDSLLEHFTRKKTKTAGNEVPFSLNK